MGKLSFFIGITFFSFFLYQVKGQSVSVNTSGAAPDSSSVLDISSNNHGLLIPRMDSSQRSSIKNPATGLMVYQTNGLNPGFYYYTGITWTRLGSGPSNIAYRKAKVTYQVPSGGSGGTAVSRAWTTRALNTVKYDDIGIALTTANEISIPPGTYDISAFCVFNNANYDVGSEKIRIQNTTNSMTLGISLNSSMSVAANYSAYPAMIHDERFTLLTNSNIALQYFIDLPDFGYSTINSSAQAEVYAEVIITKVQ